MFTLHRAGRISPRTLSLRGRRDKFVWFVWFILKSGFEEDEAEKQSDGDAHHVEDDIAGGGVTTGNRQLVDFIEGADDQGDSSRNEETELQAGRPPGSSPCRVAVRLNRSMFEPSWDGHQ